MIFLLLLLPVMSHQFTIKVQGNVEMGDQIASMLKSLYSQYSLYGERFTTASQQKKIVSKVQLNEQKVLLQAKPLLDEVMETNQIGHIYGQHGGKGKRNEKDINNILV